MPGHDINLHWLHWHVMMFICHTYMDISLYRMTGGWEGRAEIIQSHEWVGVVIPGSEGVVNDIRAL